MKQLIVAGERKEKENRGLSANGDWVPREIIISSGFARFPAFSISSAISGSFSVQRSRRELLDPSHRKQGSPLS